jgi:hypothetical protein
MARSLGGPGEAWAKEAGGAHLEEKTWKQKASKAEQTVFHMHHHMWNWQNQKLNQQMTTCPTYEKS